MAAVDRQAARDPVPDGGQAPIRTCIGCRTKASATELLRVVVTDGQAVPDPRRRAGGRGAWVHPRTTCVELAERRRAFGRALRVSGPVRSDPIREYVEALASTNSVTSTTNPTSGHPQE